MREEWYDGCEIRSRLIDGLWKKILRENFLQSLLEGTGWFHPALTGFRPSLSTHDYLWLLHRVINWSSRKHLLDYVLTLYMHKAFDNMSQCGIL